MPLNGEETPGLSPILDQAPEVKSLDLYDPGFALRGSCFLAAGQLLSAPTLCAQMWPAPHPITNAAEERACHRGNAVGACILLQSSAPRQLFPSWPGLISERLQGQHLLVKPLDHGICFGELLLVPQSLWGGLITPLPYTDPLYKDCLKHTGFHLLQISYREGAARKELRTGKGMIMKQPGKPILRRDGVSQVSLEITLLASLLKWLFMLHSSRKLTFSLQKYVGNLSPS